MVRVGPTATVSDWLHSVAEALPLPHRATRPYTLGEAIAELGAYAQAVGALKWSSPPSKKNRAAMSTEIEAQTETLGKRLRASIAPLIVDLRDDTDPEFVIAAAARFKVAWHSEVSLTDAFRDLCDAAKVPGTTSRALRKLSAIIASQIGPAAHGAFSRLNNAADALVSTEEELVQRCDAPWPEPVTETHRIEMAKHALVGAPTGRVTVWTVYYRAIVSRMRETAGPMTFLRADWALPNAFDHERNDFPERAELREIRKDVSWLDELYAESLKEENELALVRVDLGERQVAGAVEEVRRRIDAIIGVAVEAGGVSWQSADAAAILLDGKVHNSSIGLVLRDDSATNDSYGMGATSEMLTSLAGQLGGALTKGPMPEHLIEALTSLREARMTDHRDVLFYNARRVTPRVATALEDHAMELIASVLEVRPEALAKALQRRETLDRVSRQIAGQLKAPFNDAWSRERHENRQVLERQISHYSSGLPRVSIAKTVALQTEIRALPMSDLQRADFEDALAICSEPELERQLLNDIWLETSLLRARHRRVRNAVNHGLPLETTTLNSIRDYANTTSSTALNIALTWFKNGERGETLLQREENVWSERMDRLDQRLSWAAKDKRTEEGS